ncbi:MULTISPECIES: ABC transporter permease [Burkholderiaceae]|uniref:Ribose ABC transport system, permease protein RbsC n=1 Tax=Caballeronia sordidicola TaxID=196367 RepID=A0A242MII6_CABSO|nr:MULTISPECIES: ABC transporter permease [Burkholderiaceae]AMH43447.1 ABC transporter permease [Burkholderia sp. PAMC 26561]OTP71117.1 Ribose ABC transport system, permease protein RbsC [Caballeronia sordidicola]
MSTSIYTEREKGSKYRDMLLAHAQVASIAVFFIACCILFSAATPTFLTTANLLNILRQLAPMLVVAIAMTFVIATGGIDLSVGSVVALTNSLAAILMQAGLSWPVAILVTILLGAVIGLVQGWFSASQAIPSFIVTLAGLSTLRGIALYSTQGFSIPIESGTGFDFFGAGALAGIPVPAIIAIIAALIGYITINRTRYGRQVIAVGSNAEAARRSGMPALRIKASVFVISGAASAIAGLMLASRLGSGSSNAASGFELDVIAAVVLGGTSLMGGRATVVGTVLGALTIATLGNGLILLHVSPFFTQIVTGVIILLAIWSNTRVFSKLRTAKKGKK